MNWLRHIGQLEYAFIGIFLLWYLVYAIKMYTLRRKLQIRISRLSLKLLLRITYFSLFIVALLGPSFGDIKKEIKAFARDIYFVVDLSYSMDAKDIAPSRLERAKRELHQLASSLGSDRLGLLVYSNHCYWVCPPTYDKEAFFSYLQSITTSTVSAHGSNLASLESCFFQDQSIPSPESTIFILVSDGENHGKDPSPFFSKLAEHHIHTFILGIGTEQESRIPDAGKDFKKDSEGNPLVSSLNRTFLTDMAELAGGRYFEINAQGSDVKSLLHRINKIEGQWQGSKKIDSIANKYYYFLFVAIILLIVDILVTVNAVKF
ncbi:MAG: VWA domain-containing protein [Cytophagaceae bacterium]|jgi:Ca-activated chloride channel family protein|nr:VWA domain-containing protein [Cytophagaceae bacterium]